MDVERILAAIGHDGYPALGEGGVRAFERTHEVKLPEPYRLFLAEVANGNVLGIEPLGMLVEDGGPIGWHEANDIVVGALRKPFQVSRAEDAPAIDGAVPLQNRGCGEWDWLVVSGPEAGYVWRVDFDRARPLEIDGRPVDFEKYVEMQLPAGELGFHAILGGMATLHFICGKAGAGKTTLARELGRTLPAVVFCEDEWISRLGFEVRSLEDFLAASAKCRNMIGPLAGELLRLGVSVVFDFGGNTTKGRQWVRAVFEAAHADHALHVIEASDSKCLDNIHKRNDEKPEGVYWGHVSDQIFQAVTVYFAPPQPEEGFHITAHDI